jgi:O-antigen/teichoic acid export membrane protein
MPRGRSLLFIILIFLLVLPLLLYAPVALGHRTLLPVDALFLDQPYRAAADVLGVGRPQNPLLTDLILENYAWKQFLKDAVRARQLPLWDPFIFAGHPFLANGQHSGLYPLSLLFYVIPLWRAFGLFAWLQLALAGWWAYLFARTLGVGRLGALLSGVVFQLSGFMVVSVVHPMIVAAASWLPFLLAMMERVIRQRPALGGRPATLPWALLGAIGLGCNMLAGHAENTYFVLLVMALYAIWRLAGSWWAEGRAPVRAALWLAVLVVLGLALGTVQYLPLYEVVADSFRSGEMAASLAQVRGWAYPPRRLITFGIPNFFGSPAHHGHFDLFQWRWVPATVNAQGEPILSHDWGIKNYVEGGAYLGLLPLFLAVIAVLGWIVPRIRKWVGAAVPAGDGLSVTARTTIPFFTLLSLFSLGCIFGTPLYAVVYALPFLSQSHSPFRWVFPLTLSVAILAGFGIDAVRRRRQVREDAPRSPILRLLLLDTAPSLVSGFAALAFWGGAVTLVGIFLSRIFFAQIEPLVGQVFLGLAKAPQAFADHRAFYSYEFKWISLFGLFLTATGIVLRVSRCPIFVRRRPIWEFLAISVLALDLVAFGAGFNPAVNPALLNYTPPVVDFLRQDTSVWRYATFTPPGTTKTMNANVGMFYDLQTVAGYDSLFSRQYADYMALIEEQDQLQFNRIASFSEWSSLDSPLLDLLNVKYVITEVEIPNPAKYELVYQDEAVRVYENRSVIPRAFTLPTSAAVVAEDVDQALRTYDPHQFVVLEAPGDTPPGAAPQPATLVSQSITAYEINEVFVDSQVAEASWLVLTDSYFPGWRAFVRPQGTGEDQEQEVEIARVDGTFRGVRLEPGAWTVRFKYSPNAVKVGAFVSFIAGMTILFLVGLYLWRFFYREEDDASTVKRVAKNSIAPIVLNLFNRSIDFAGAALMARILGPVGTGQYMTAVSIYLWFDILANFGLDMYLMREVARDRSRARRLFLTTTALRLLLYLVVVPLLVGFLVGWQALGSTLAPETVWAVVLLYAALLPGSVAYGLAALFRGCERHEIPAAIQTVTTIIKVTLWVPVLVGGLGVIGVAGAAVVTNVVTLGILAVLAGRLIWPDLPPVETSIDWSLTRPMLVESWPLMASLLLQALFPGMNVLLLQSLQGDLLVGWYDAARKWVDALNIVPQFFTFAVFPVMSRQATEDQTGLRRSYGLSVKLLVLVALPAAAVVTLLATPLVGLLSGSRFLPHGAIALRLLVWSILFGWVNSLTNYVLIALNRQRYVLLASGTRVVFTVVANLLFVPRFSYLASTWIIIGGECLLAILFYLDLRRHLGPVAWVRMLGRPLLAGLAMGAVAWALASFSLPLAILASVLAYGGALVVLRAVSPEEWEMLAPLIPAPVRRFLA